MTYNPEIHNRRSIRLKGYDYSQAGAYFVTICTNNREFLFGEISNGVMALNEYGRIVEIEWLKTPEIRPNIELLEYIIMPNHFHGIVVIDENRRGVLQYAPTTASSHKTTASTNFRSPSQTIGAIIRGFKSAVTKKINIDRSMPGIPVWQRNYYEHIIRDDESYYRISEYIKNNPVNWQKDDYYDQ